MPDPLIVLKHFYEIAHILQAVSVGLGIALFTGGFFKLKRYGEMRTFMSHQMTLTAPMMRILAGIALLIFPTFVATVMNVMWGTASPLTYSGSSIDSLDQWMPVIITFVRIIGIVAIIRSLILFARSGQTGGQPGIVGKASIHLFSGLLLLHIIGAYHLLLQVFNIL